MLEQRLQVSQQQTMKKKHQFSPSHFIVLSMLWQAVKMDTACPSVCSVTLTHPPVKLTPAIQVSFLPIYRNKMSSQKVSLQQIHRQRLEQSTGQKY